jgi:hypothetical protein
MAKTERKDPSMRSATSGAIAILALSLILSCQGTEQGRRGDGTDADGGTDTGGGDSDSDGDTDYDPQTADSDGDGLSDQYEDGIGTDPHDKDTDGDGVSDLAEVVAGTDPLDPDSNPRKEGNFYFTVPYMGAPEPLRDALVFSTNIKKADLFILIDTTGSMGFAIAKLKAGLSTVIIPQVAAIIPDTWFGIGRFDDYPNGTYGNPPDKVFALVQRTTDDEVVAENAVKTLSVHDGGDASEAHVPALWATATGQGLGSYLAAQTGCGAGEIGYPCFRKGAVPIIMVITDTTFHNGPSNYAPYSGLTPVPPAYAGALAALKGIHAKVMGIKVAQPLNMPSPMTKTHLSKIATDTGTVDASSNPLVYEVNANGAGLDTDVVDAVATLAQQVPMDISAVARDDTSDAVDATVFVDHIAPSAAGGVEDPENPGVICVGGLDVQDEDSDGVPDMFPALTPGTSVCFDIFVKMNKTVKPTQKPEVYKAFIDVMGDSNTVLDTREIFFLVPPSSPVV